MTIAYTITKRQPGWCGEPVGAREGQRTRKLPCSSELVHDAEKSAKVAQHLAVIEEFASLLDVLPYTAMASLHSGAIRSALEKACRPMGINDLHIAAHARS